MTKELFIEAIEAIRKQHLLDIEVSEHLSKAFPESFAAGLLPRNHFLGNALMRVLQEAMNDTMVCKYGISWIEYFCWELNFGEENYRLKAYRCDKSVIPLSNAGELYDFLVGG